MHITGIRSSTKTRFSHRAGLCAGGETAAPQSPRQAVRRGDPAVAQQRRHRPARLQLDQALRPRHHARRVHQGRGDLAYVPAFGAHLFLSADTGDVKRALADGYAAATIVASAVERAETDGLRLAFDGDAVIFSDESERVYQEQGLVAFARARSMRRAGRSRAGRSRNFWPRCTGSRRIFPRTRALSARRSSPRAARRRTSA